MDYWHKKWQCPFFIWDDITQVRCEGGCVAKFPDKETANKFMKQYCANIHDWSTCSLADALLQYYERKEKANEQK